MSRIQLVDLTTSRTTYTWESQTSLQGVRSIGVFRFKEITKDFFIYPVDKDEIEYFKKFGRINFNDAYEKIFKYETSTTRIGKMSPLVKMNMKTGRIYFLNSEFPDRVIFDKKGVLPLFVSLNTRHSL